MGEMENRLKAELTSGRGTGLNWCRRLSSQHDLCKVCARGATAKGIYNY